MIKGLIETLRRDLLIQNTQNSEFSKVRQKTWNMKNQINSGGDDQSNHDLSNLDDIIQENENNLNQDTKWNMEAVKNRSVSNSNNSDINHLQKHNADKKIKRNKNLISLKDAKARSQSSAAYQNMFRYHAVFNNNYINK